MMICPEVYAKEHEDKSYKELIKERDRLIRDIRAFEKGKVPIDEYMICPSPDVIYKCNLEYLAKICHLIVEKYRNRKEPDLE